MGISGKAWRRLAAAVAVPGAAIGALAGFSVAPAMAGTAQPKPYGIETLHGHIVGAGLNPRVPVYESGVFSDRGYIDLGGDGHTIYLNRGNIYIDTSNNGHTDKIDREVCTSAHTETFDYHITGGSGLYKDADGRGSARIQVTTALRRHNGICDGNEPVPGTSSLTIDARGSFRHGHM